ncbi:hematopoietically-expressed homeobox protein hhex-like [Rhinoraja longicauda]
MQFPAPWHIEMSPLPPSSSPSPSPSPSPGPSPSSGLPTPFYIQDILGRDVGGIGSRSRSRSRQLPTASAPPPARYSGALNPDTGPGHPALSPYLCRSPLLTDSPAQGQLRRHRITPLGQGRAYFWNPFSSRALYKRKGGQVRFSTNQTLELMKVFGKQKYLTPPERMRLGRGLQLSERQVKTWFQNRRAKWQRMKQPSSILPVSQELPEDEKSQWIKAGQEDLARAGLEVRSREAKADIVGSEFPPRDPGTPRGV